MKRMRHLWGCLLTGIFVLSSVSCSEDETAALNAKETNINFSLNICDQRTLNADMPCEEKGLREPELANTLNDAYARFSILLEDGTELTDIIREMKYVDFKGKKHFMIDPVVVPFGQHFVTKLNVIKREDTSEKVVLSAIEDDLNDDHDISKQEINDLHIPLTVTKKNEYPVYPMSVFCVNKRVEKSSDLEVLESDRNFKYHIPFMVNICPEGMHTVAEGRLEVWLDGDYNATEKEDRDKVWTEEGSWKAQELPFKPGTYKKIIFSNNQKFANKIEFYRFKMYLYDVSRTEPVWDVVTSVDELLNFQFADAWLSEMRMMDINLCNQIDWIFDEEHQYKP